MAYLGNRDALIYKLPTYSNARAHDWVTAKNGVVNWKLIALNVPNSQSMLDAILFLFEVMETRQKVISGAESAVKRQKFFVAHVTTSWFVFQHADSI